MRRVFSVLGRLLALLAFAGAQLSPGVGAAAVYNLGLAPAHGTPSDTDYFAAQVSGTNVLVTVQASDIYAYISAKLASSGVSAIKVSGLAASVNVCTDASSNLITSCTNEVAITNLAQIAANTILGNGGGSTGNVAAMAMPSCSTSFSILQWTAATGFTCATGIWAAPPVIGGTTPAAITATTLNATTSLSVGGKLLCSATTPTISSGFGTSPSISAANSCGFTVTVGTGGASNGVVAMGTTAPNGWNCQITDVTSFTTVIFLTRETSASTTSTVTVNNWTTSATSANWGAGDKLQFQCFPY
jgi:hypothetical protein